MSYKIYDFECPQCHRQDELMVEDIMSPTCKDCGVPMEKHIPAPKGYVIGTSTPTKC